MIMLLLDGQQDKLALDAILVTAISGAQRLGLHRLSDVKLVPSRLVIDASTVSMEPHVRTEIAVRIWWVTC